LCIQVYYLRDIMVTRTSAQYRHRPLVGSHVFARRIVISLGCECHLTILSAARLSGIFCGQFNAAAPNIDNWS
jgi:hypothetical protein